MSIFAHPEFDEHETIAYGFDAKSGLHAIVAVHNTVLGPGLGGCRVYNYSGETDALTDVLRLSRGMTYKAALAGLNQGGGKSVVMADPRSQKTPEMMRAMGRLVQSLGGKYLVAEDSGSNDADMREMAKETQYVAGHAAPINPEDAGDRDTSAATALGVFVGIQAAVKFQLGREDLTGLRVAIQGVGKVGQVLAAHLHAAGARLWVCDTYAPAVKACVEQFAAVPVAMADILKQNVDVFSPCALGAIFDDETIPQLRAKIIAGAANNQLAKPGHGKLLQEKGVLYAPDYVINAGGIINLYYEGPQRRWALVEQHVLKIGPTLSDIFARSKSASRPTNEIADEMAEARFKR